MSTSHQPSDPDNNVRLDVGGWISGPSLDPPLPPPPSRDVPPGSSALRELAAAVENTLALPNPATTRDEVSYLLIMRDRARVVRLTCRRILADREADDRDIMAITGTLRDQAAQLGDDTYDHAPEPTL